MRNMFTYIKQSKNPFVVLENELVEGMGYALGSNYGDYLDNKWVLLTEEQAKFHEENPEATVEEVLNMKLVEVDHTAEYRAKMIRAIDAYDQSPEVNGFEVEGIGVYWFDAATRANYKQSIEASKLLGNTQISFFIGETLVNIPIEKAEYMLAVLQNYADQCYIQTQLHIQEVNKLTADELTGYDYKKGYPKRPYFTLTMEG